MMIHQDDIKELEWCCLDQRFNHLRRHTPQAVQSLMLSLQQYGQLSPIWVIGPEDKGQWVVIDGYLRIQALQQLGTETIKAKISQHTLAQALVESYTNQPLRAWEALEEAQLIDYLMEHCQWSQNELSRQLGKSKAWVAHRLMLIKGLPDTILEAINQGVISLWVAQRVLAPFARANTVHVEKLLGYLNQHYHTSRAIHAFYAHYCQSNHAVREQMIEQPDLFFKCHHWHEQQAKPWLEELAQVSDTLQKVQQLVAELYMSTSDVPAIKRGLTMLTEIEKLLQEFTLILRRLVDA